MTEENDKSEMGKEIDDKKVEEWFEKKFKNRCGGLDSAGSKNHWNVFS